MKKYENLYEMSKPISWVINKTQSLEPQINKHLLKILLFETESTWKKDASNWLVEISSYTIKPDDKFLKKKQYFEFLFNEPFEQGNKKNNQTTIYKYCSIIFNQAKYDGLYSKYRNDLKNVPVEQWKDKFKRFYIEVDDYMSKGILDTSICNMLIETYFVKE
jgi:hypothetical protein